MGLIIDTHFFINVENEWLDLSALNKFTDYGEAYIAAITASEPPREFQLTPSGILL